MCGIVGLLQFSGFSGEAEAACLRLRQALKHRGPDDAGLYVSPCRTAALGQVRLSILDLSPAGHQPMAAAGGRYQIVFNGEIFNFRALRQELESRHGVVFQTQSDTEVILQAWIHWGEKSFARLRGMYAFVIWDDQEKTAIAARDPLGIKPLYLYHSGGTLTFASEVRTLLQSGFVPARLNPDGLYSYLLRGYVMEPHTLVEGVQSLTPGTWMRWHAGSVKHRVFWTFDNILPQQRTRQSFGDSVAQVREALVDSVKHHLVSDVPVGLFLSGGLDSSSLLALTVAQSRVRPATYSISFNERNFDEGPIAARVAQHFGSEHHDWQLTADEGRELFVEHLQALDQPSTDGFNTYCVSAFARRGGSKVVLSGVGGDELFGSYPTFARVPALQRFAQAATMVPKAASALGKRLQTSSRSQVRRIGDLLEGPTSLHDAYRCYRGLFTRSETAELFPHFLPVSLQPRDEMGLRMPSSRLHLLDRREGVGLLELSQYMRAQLLRDSDVMSMAHGLELRVPMVDTEFARAVLAVPTGHRYAAQKKLLSDAVGNLPEWLLRLPKRGFSFPLQQWVRSEWNDLFQRVRERHGRGIPLGSWARPYSLFVLEYWLERHGVEFAVEPQGLPAVAVA